MSERPSTDSVRIRDAVTNNDPQTQQKEYQATVGYRPSGDPWRHHIKFGWRANDPTYMDFDNAVFSMAHELGE